MKTPSKLVLGLTVAATAVAPMIPKSVSITINPPGIVAEVESCKIISTRIDDHGNRICEYRCNHNFIFTKGTHSLCDETFRRLEK
jgi:hypothetical protein